MLNKSAQHLTSNCELHSIFSTAVASLIYCGWSILDAHPDKLGEQPNRAVNLLSGIRIELKGEKKGRLKLVKCRWSLEC